MTSLPVVPAKDACWNRIGVWGDRTCPELVPHVHCHNCPVYTTAGRRFLDAPSPAGYLDEWTDRLASPIEETAADQYGVLIFRLADEWLALPVRALVEVTPIRPVHRIPHRGGLLAGMVNIRGELHLCVRLDHLLGIGRPEKEMEEPLQGQPVPRLLVVRREDVRWVFAVDEVDQVYRLSEVQTTAVPATLARYSGRLARGVFSWQG